MTAPGLYDVAFDRLRGFLDRWDGWEGRYARLCCSDRSEQTYLMRQRQSSCNPRRNNT
jgi:hypothetical protein